MADLINTVNELLKGKQIKENLSLYEKEMRTLYHRKGWLYLAFHYYSFGEVFFEIGEAEKEFFAKDAAQIERFIDGCVTDPSSLSYESLLAFRDALIPKVRSLTNYADRLMIYEYILNRVEFRFKRGEFSDDYYTRQLENDLMQYAVSDTDSSVIHMKMSRLVGELPMRLSKSKFFDLLLETLTLYKGSAQKTVLEFLERIRSAGTLEPVENSYFSALFDRYEQVFLSVDFETVAEEQYDALRSTLEEATVQIEQFTDWYIMIVGVVNDLCTVALTQGALEAVKEHRIILQIVEGVHTAIRAGKEIDPSVEKYFASLEGIQEKLCEKMFRPEDSLSEIRTVYRETIESEGLALAYRRLETLSRLQSSSTFADLTVDESGQVPADEAFIALQHSLLVAGFEELFSVCGRMKKRAVMAAVLQNLPSFFQTPEAFQNYVHTALMQCSDPAERQACMTLTDMIMAEE